MPLPLIPIIGGAIVAAAGGTAIHGAAKMKDASDDLKEAQEREKRNLERQEQKSSAATHSMDILGERELKILCSFREFSDIIEKIQHRPSFEDIQIEGVHLPDIDVEGLKGVSVGAVLLKDGLASATAGSAAGLAAKGVGTAAIKAAFSAAVKPVHMAGGALAGGTSAAGSVLASGGASIAGGVLTGGGASIAGGALVGSGASVAGGSIIATGAGAGMGTLGLGIALSTLAMPVGLLIGGVTLSATGSKLSDKADEAQKQVNETEHKINAICTYLSDLKRTADKYRLSLMRVDAVYQERLSKLKAIVCNQGKTDWYEFTSNEIRITQETVLLVKKLYAMCKVQLVTAAEKEGEPNKINHSEIKRQVDEAEEILSNLS